MPLLVDQDESAGEDAASAAAVFAEVDQLTEADQGVQACEVLEAYVRTGVLLTEGILWRLARGYFHKVGRGRRNKEGGGLGKDEEEGESNSDAVSQR